MEVKLLNTKLNNVWRTCNKIRLAIARIGINLWNYFQPLDTNKNNLISESKFVNILLQIRGQTGLSEQEIAELTDYFKVQDGRIAYYQFCNVIYENVPDHSQHSDLISGLEWEDPYHKNRLAQHEHRRLCVLLTKIAQSVRLRDLVLRPYFQDYELISKNTGTVTFPHFSRVLHFLGIKLSNDDFHLLVKRFIKDSYTINYIGFVDEIEKIVRYLDTHRMLDFSEDVITNFPGRLIDCELPKLPRPEIGTIRMSDVFGKETSFHPVLKKPSITRDANEIVLRIQRFVHENRIRVYDFFEDFDSLKSGTITKPQFLRGLDKMGVSGLNRLYFSDKELNNLLSLYENEVDINCIDWKLFNDDIDKVFTENSLDKKPFTIVKSPPSEIANLKRDGQENWQDQTNAIRNECEECLFKIKCRISKRRLNLEQFFKDLDKLNTCHVSRSQMRRIILTNGILLSDEELYALEKRYNNDIGFNYVWFLSEADPKDFGIPTIEECKQQINGLTETTATAVKPNLNDDENIIQILAKIKGHVARNRIRLIDFMNGFDPLNHQLITNDEFKRSLNTAGINNLNATEVNTICNVFKSPLRNNNVDYNRFCKTIEEVFYQTCLERGPLIVPLQHVPIDDGPANFLNFDERNIVTNVLQILSKHPDQISNLSSIFQDYDKVNCGTLSESQFLRALTVRELNNLFSNREFQVLCKCFGKERGLRMEIDYRSFLKCLDILYATKTNYPF